MPAHRFFVAQALSRGASDCVVEGDEAAHAARVKRIEIGEEVELLDGVGGRATGLVAEFGGSKKYPTVRVQVQRVVNEPPPPRMVEVWSALPKGERAGEMVDQLSQVGVWSWRPLRCRRGVTGPRDAKMERLGRIAIESAKQCGRSWVMRIDEEAGIEDAAELAVAGADASRGVVRPRVWFADVGGESVLGVVAKMGGSVRVLVGPEGGWAPEEVDLFKAAGIGSVRLGSNVMRIETAGVVAGAVFAAGGMAGG